MRQLYSWRAISLVVLVSLILAALTGMTGATIERTFDLTMSDEQHFDVIRDADYRKNHDRIVEKARIKAEEEAKQKAYQALLQSDVNFSKGSTSATLIRKISTTKPVVFLTIDDGLVKNPDALQYIKDHKLNPTLFLTDQIIRDNYDYFRTYQDAGIKIENHTLTHADLTKLSQSGQQSEICGQSDRIQSVYGVRPTIMRPPYGSFNDSTLVAAHNCGIDYVVHWSAKVDGGAVQYQRGSHLVAGDVVLMHFRPMMMEDLKAFNNEVTSQGLTPAYLSDWLN